MKRKEDFHNAGETYDERLQNKFTAYVCRIANNEQRRCQFLRDKAKAMLLFQQESELFQHGRIPFQALEHQPDREREPTTWHDVLENLDSEKLYRALCRLSEEDANILFLHVIFDLRYTDMERITGMSAEEIQRRYTMTVRKLRRAMNRGRK